MKGQTNTALGPPGWGVGRETRISPPCKRSIVTENIKHGYINATRLGNEKISSEKHYGARQEKPKGSREVEAPSNNQEDTKDEYMEIQNLV